MGYDHGCFAAAILDAAVKGIVRIEQDENKYTLIRTGSTKSRDLSPDERKLLAKLFGAQEKLWIDQSNHDRIGKAVQALKDALALALEKRYFVRNRPQFVPGAVLSALVLIFSRQIRILFARVKRFLSGRAGDQPESAKDSGTAPDSAGQPDTPAPPPKPGARGED